MREGAGGIGDGDLGARPDGGSAGGGDEEKVDTDSDEQLREGKTVSEERHVAERSD